ncbi:MAG: hypothetical protein Q9212_005505 [Teloschistes hypoglaucus]
MHNGTALEMDYGYLYASGYITVDDFNVNSIQVKGQPFLEATTVQPIGSSWDDLSLIHGILGLAPSDTGSTLHNPSLFVSMASQDLLSQNVLSMRLREPSGITFGTIDSRLFTGDITRIPLTNRTGKYALNGTWQAETRYMTLGSEPGLRLPLAGYTASFSTLTAFIFLPDPLAMQIIEMLEFENIMFLPPSVECEKLKYLPDITFNLAGKNFTLTPYDYTIEWPIEPGNVRCVSAIMPFGLEQNEEIVLGSAFLRAFYSVFDLDTNTIGCKSAVSIIIVSWYND